MRALGAAVTVVAAVLLVGCSSGIVDVTTGSKPAEEASFGPLGAAGCDPASPVQGDQVQATASAGASAYGLLFSATPETLSSNGSTIKMVVRITGQGDDLAASLVAPDGSRRSLAWGPERHGGSTFDRPGEEWGVGFAFDEPGCWRVALERGNTTADFWFRAG